MDRNDISAEQADWIRDKIKTDLDLPWTIPVVVIVPEIDLTVAGREPDAIEAEHIRHG